MSYSKRKALNSFFSVLFVGFFIFSLFSHFTQNKTVIYEIENHQLRSKALSPTVEYISWSGVLDYNEYFVFWTDEDVDDSYDLHYLFKGTNFDIDITLKAMTNTSYDSWAFSDSFSISSYTLFEGPNMTDGVQSFSQFDSDTSWAFIFLNEDSDRESTNIDIDCFLWGTPDVTMTGKKLKVVEETNPPFPLEQLLPLLIIIAFLGISGVVFIRKRRSSASSRVMFRPASPPSDSTYTQKAPSSIESSYVLGQEKQDEIVSNAVAKAQAQAKANRGQNIRNAIFSFIIGGFILTGGILSLEAGVGIYLLIAGTMVIGLGIFLLLLTLIK